MLTLTENRFNEIVKTATELCPPVENWFPTRKDAETLCRNIEKNLEFLIWIVDSNPEMRLTAEQKETRKFIRQQITENITIDEKTSSGVNQEKKLEKANPPNEV